MRINWFFVIFGIITIIAIDQMSKFFVKKYYFYTENFGIAFGIPFKGIPLLITNGFLIALIAFFIWKYMNIEDLKGFISASLLLGGSISNYIERLINGKVVDFIDLKFWPSFNIADAAIMLGMLIFLLFHKTLLFNKSK